MGIKIAHEPIAAPIIASYATGVGRAAERRTQRQLEMLSEKQTRDHRSMLQRTELDWRATENAADRAHDFERDRNRYQFNLDINDQRNQQYRDRDRLDWIMADIQARQKALLGKPLTKEGKEAWGGLKKQLDALRTQKGEQRPGVYAQGLTTWLENFDSQYDESWIEQAPNPVERMDREGVYVLPDGNYMSTDEYRASGRGDGALKLPDDRGKLQDVTGGQNTDTMSPEEKYDKAYERAYKELEKAQANAVEPSPITLDDVEKRMAEYEERRRKAVEQQTGAGAGLANTTPDKGTGAPLRDKSLGKPAPPGDSGAPMSTARGPQPGTAATTQPAVPPREPYAPPALMAHEEAAMAATPQPPAGSAPESPAQPEQQKDLARNILKNLRAKYPGASGPEDMSPPDRAQFEMATRILDGAMN